MSRPSKQEIAEHSRQLAQELSKEHGFVCMPTSFKRPMVAGWQKLRETYEGPLWDSCNGVGIVTGEPSGISVIDVDAPDKEWFHGFCEHYDLQWTMWVVTPGGGYHLYFKYDERLKNGKFQGTSIDIRNKGGQIIAPGSYYFSKDPKKAKQNGKKYIYFMPEDDLLDFEHIRELDDIFLQWKAQGMNRETYALGRPKPGSKARRIHDCVRKVRSTVASGLTRNQRTFVSLLQEYSKCAGNGYEEWLDGLWAACDFCKEQEWDPLPVIDYWCARLDGYKGTAEVADKIGEWNPERSKGFGHLAAHVPPKAMDQFDADFEHFYCYSDYKKILRRRPYVNIKSVREYIQQAFVRIDRMGSVMWYARNKANKWEPLKRMFNGEDAHPFTYQVPNPKYKPNDKNCNQPEFKEKETTLRAQIIKNQLTLVRNKDDLQFLPFYGEDPTPRDTFNAFSGYVHDILPDSEYDEKDEDFQFVMTHWRDIICNKNQEFFEYLMNWLSWLLRFGYKKPRTAIVIHGRQGGGKDTLFGRLLGEGVIGKRYVHTPQNMKRFVGRFNSMRLNSCLHVFNECTSTANAGASKYGISNMMKTAITEKHINVEPKGKEAYQALDPAGCILMSNSDLPVIVENDDRRYAIIQIARELPGREHFKRLSDLVESARIQRTFFTYLLKRDLSDWNMDIIPRTASKSHIQAVRPENYIIHFLTELVNGELRESDDTFYQWFDMREYKRLSPEERNYSQALVYDKYKQYHLRQGGPQCMASRMLLKKRLIEHGLVERKKVTCKSYGGKQCHCWNLDRDNIREVARSWLRDPQWDYKSDIVDPEASD